MPLPTHDHYHAPTAARSGWLGRALSLPLYVYILAAIALGVVVGLLLGEEATHLKPISDLVLRMLGAIAIPLIGVAVLHALVRAHITGKSAARLVFLLLTNTVVAILVGLAVANTIQPGRGAVLPPSEKKITQQPYDIVDDTTKKIPTSALRPFVENEVVGVIIIAIALGVAFRVVRQRQQARGSTAYRSLEDALQTLYEAVLVVLHWVVTLVPLAVFAVVARVTGTLGLAAFKPLLWFVFAVLLALAIQAGYYIFRLRMGSWVRPGRFLRGGSDALVMAFSTASSAATMPLTYACMKEKVGVREESAGLGVLVGGTFNHDGTALYEAMAALFISQAIGKDLGPTEQVLVVLMSVVASVGAAGIPEAGLVTMIAVFSAVGLDVEHIPILLTVDWFLDRCRTTINVMGDMCVTCLLDGTQAPAPAIALDGGSGPPLSGDTAVAVDPVRV